jgi:hypothetical protein
VSWRTQPWASEGGNGLLATSRLRQAPCAHETQQDGTCAWAWRGGGAGGQWRWWRRSWRRGKGSGNQGVVWPGVLWGGCRDGGGSTRVRSVASTSAHGSHPHRSHATQTTTKRCSGVAGRHGRGWEKKGGRRCRETAGEGRGWALKWHLGEESYFQWPVDLTMMARRVFREQVRRRLRMGQFLLYTRSLWFFCTTTVSR